MTDKKSRTLEPLAFDEYCRFDTPASVDVLEDKASLALSPLEKKADRYQNGNIHRKLTILTSEREGKPGAKLSNPRAPPARDAWRKFTEIYGNPRANAAHTLCIYFLPIIGTVVVVLEYRYAVDCPVCVPHQR
jgi:hypothetical protein